MEGEAMLRAAVELLAPWARESGTPEPGRRDVVVDAGDLLDAVAALRAAGAGYLAAITGLDEGPAGAIEVLYHFCAGAAVLTLRARLQRDAATVPSLCAIVPSAGLFERELREMLGVDVDGLPDPSRLYVAEDWPAGVYPLRKDAVI